MWAGLVTVGLAAVARYANTPGQAADNDTGWPGDLPFRPVGRELTLLLSIHPRCPCSRATLMELSRILAKSNGRIGGYVLFIKPRGAPTGWERGALRDIAIGLPDVRVLTDDDGKWSARLGAATSGQTYAFDRSGRLRFSGGITASRGHEGENAGSNAILALLSNRTNDRAPSTPVFGCPLGNCPEK